MGLKNNILVIGENCLDRFIFCNCNRLAPEGPFPILTPSKVVENPGMAANVARHLISLQFKNEYNIVELLSREVITKTRYVDEKTNHYFIRFDENDSIKEALTEESFYNFLNKNSYKVEDFAAVVISEYNKGFLSKNIINFITSIFKNYVVPVFLDTKYILGEWSKDVFVVKINEKEYNNHRSFGIYNPLCKNLVTTLGGNGAIHNNITYKTKEFHVLPNVSGAGDVFHAALAIFYLEHKNLSSAIGFAVKAASYKVTQRGIPCISRKEIDSLSDFN